MHVNQHVARGDGHGNRFFGNLSMASRFSDENCTMTNGNRRFVMRVFYIRVFFLQIGIMGFNEDRISEYKMTINITIAILYY